MTEPQKRIYENYIKQLQMENTQLRQELETFKQVKGKTICVLRSINPIHKTDTSRI